VGKWERSVFCDFTIIATPLIKDLDLFQLVFDLKRLVMCRPHRSMPNRIGWTSALTYCREAASVALNAVGMAYSSSEATWRHLNFF
jgi:hypothetical protein